MSLQQEVGTWGDTTFPLSVPRSVMAHLSDEITELADEVDAFTDCADATTRAALAEEAADCFLLLLHLAHKCGFDLNEAAQAKFEKNQVRVWGEPDERGVVRHVTQTNDGQRRSPDPTRG